MEKTDLKIEIRNYEVFEREILTPGEYVEICEDYDAVDDREDRDQIECLSGDHPLYTRVYKTIRRTCTEQQQIIEAGRDLALMSLAFKILSNLDELVLVFQQTGVHEDWLGVINKCMI